MQVDKIRDEVRNDGTAIIEAQATGVASCCDSVLLTTCCQPGEKESCCGVEHAADHDAAPRTCGCSASPPGFRGGC
jgi:hypothetical protein